MYVHVWININIFHFIWIEQQNSKTAMPQQNDKTLTFHKNCTYFCSCYIYTYMNGVKCVCMCAFEWRCSCVCVCACAFVGERVSPRVVQKCQMKKLITQPQKNKTMRKWMTWNETKQNVTKGQKHKKNGHQNAMWNIINKTSEPSYPLTQTWTLLGKVALLRVSNCKC